MKDIKKYIAVSLLLSSVALYAPSEFDSDYNSEESDDSGDEFFDPHTGDTDSEDEERQAQAAGDRGGKKPQVTARRQQSTEVIEESGPRIARTPTRGAGKPTTTPRRSATVHQETVEELVDQVDTSRTGSLSSVAEQLGNAFEIPADIESYVSSVKAKITAQRSIITELQKASANRFLTKDEVAQLKQAIDSLERQFDVFQRLFKSGQDVLRKRLQQAVLVARENAYLTMDTNNHQFYQDNIDFLSRNIDLLNESDLNDYLTANADLLNRRSDGTPAYRDYQLAQALRNRQQLLSSMITDTYKQSLVTNVNARRVSARAGLSIAQDLTAMDKLNIKDVRALLTDPSQLRSDNLTAFYNKALRSGLITDLNNYRLSIEAAIRKASFNEVVQFYRDLNTHMKSKPGQVFDQFTLYATEVALASKIRSMFSDLKAFKTVKSFSDAYGDLDATLKNLKYLQDESTLLNDAATIDIPYDQQKALGVHNLDNVIYQLSKNVQFLKSFTSAQ